TRRSSDLLSLSLAFGRCQSFSAGCCYVEPLSSSSVECTRCLGGQQAALLWELMPVVDQPLARSPVAEWNSLARDCSGQFANGYGEVILASPRTDKQKSVITWNI